LITYCRISYPICNQLYGYVGEHLGYRMLKNYLAALPVNVMIDNQKEHQYEIFIHQSVVCVKVLCV